MKLKGKVKGVSDRGWNETNLQLRIELEGCASLFRTFDGGEKLHIGAILSIPVPAAELPKWAEMLGKDVTFELVTNGR